MKFNFLLILSLCILYVSKCNNDTLENILFRASSVTLSGNVVEEFEKKSSSINVLIHHNPIFRVDAADGFIHVDFPDIKIYKNEYSDYLAQVQEFNTLGFDTFIRFSQDNSKMHLNFNTEMNRGYFINEVNFFENAKTGDRSVQVRIEHLKFNKNSLIVQFDFESLRSIEEIKMLVDNLATMKRNANNLR